MNMEETAVPNPVRAWVRWLLLLGLALVLFLALAPLLTAIRSDQLSARADELWTSFDEVWTPAPPPSIETALMQPFASVEALFAWAEAEPAPRTELGYDLFSGEQAPPVIDHLEAFGALLDADPLDPRALPALARGCRELRAAGSLLNLAVAASLAHDLRAAVEQGRVAAAAAARFELAPTLDDLRAAIVFEAQGALNWLDEDLASVHKLASGFGLLDDDWARLRVALAERALVAASAPSFARLEQELTTLDEELLRSSGPTWWRALYGDGLLVDLAAVQLASLTGRLGEEAGAWRELREAVGDGAGG